MIINDHDYRKSDRLSLLATFDWPNDKKDRDKALDNDETFMWILDGPAYKDFSARTVKGLTKDDSTDLRHELARKLHEYINYVDISNWYQSNYDEWHRKTCDEFIEGINNIEERKEDKKVAFGKAQKIVNMSFKYLFCLKDAEDERYAEKFKFCHMPLDSFTLEWYKQAVVPWCRKKDVHFKFVANGLQNWSNLKYGECNDPYSYSGIQHLIREYLSKGIDGFVDEKGRSFTPFTAEFYIWQEQQLRSALKSIQNQSKAIKQSFPSYRNDDLKSLCQKSERALVEISKHF